jgi:3-oxoacyl-[acyl-carrier-protein] synthase II
MTRPVAISGLGAVGAFGAGVEALAKAWRAGGVEPAEVDRSAGYHRAHGARRALLASGVDLAAWLPANQARRMSTPARFAVAAARLALADAGLAGLTAEEHLRTAVVVGTAFGPAAVTEQLLAQILHQGPEAASPALFTESVASASAAQVALAFRARGPNLAVTQREASDLIALAEGARLIARGAADRALVIVVDEMIPLLHAVLDRFHALARPDADGGERARPFDRRRSGVLAAEGAAVAVLESPSAIAARGGRSYARLRTAVRAFDPTAPAWDHGTDAAGLARTLARGLDRAGLTPAELDVVMSGASGSLRGDRLEAGLLRTLFDGVIPPVLAPKDVLGAWGGGFLVAAILAASGRASAPVSGFRELDPELALRPATDPRPLAPRRTLVSATATGGAAAWAVLERDEPAGALAPEATI